MNLGKFLSPNNSTVVTMATVLAGTLVTRRVPSHLHGEASELSGFPAGRGAMNTLISVQTKQRCCLLPPLRLEDLQRADVSFTDTKTLLQGSSPTLLWEPATAASL